MSADLRLDGKTALVTGASRGIGAAIAYALAEQGARLVLVARGQEALARTAARIDALGVECSILPLDVTDREGSARAVGEWVETAGPVDVLVSCAGGNVRKAAEAYRMEEWDALLALNLGQMESFDPSQSAQLLKSLTGGLGIALLTTVTGLTGNILLGLQLMRLDRFADALVADALALSLKQPHTTDGSSDGHRPTGP